MFRPAAILLCAAYIVIFCLTCIVGIHVELIPASRLIGNSAENIARLKSTVNPDDFTFCVMGDVKGGAAIKDGTITETVISNKKRLETLELIERNLAVYLWPFLTRSAGHTSAVILMLVMAMVYSGFSLKRLKRCNRSRLNVTLAGVS